MPTKFEAQVRADLPLPSMGFFDYRGQVLEEICKTDLRCSQ